MRPLMQELLSQRPEVRNLCWYLEYRSRRHGRVRAARAIADDPMIDRIPPEVHLGPHDINGRRRSSADREPAEVPQSSLAGKPVAHRVFGRHLKDRRVPFPPSFEPIPRAECLG